MSNKLLPYHTIPLITGYFDTTKILMESKSQLKQYIIVNYMVLYIVQLCFM